MEQLVARWAHNPKVVGSSPTPATRREKTDLFGLFLFYESSCTTYVQQIGNFMMVGSWQMSQEFQ